jgi:AraC family transcriptional activator of pobA
MDKTAWTFSGDMDRTAIPEFFVYGVPARRLDVGFVHVETVRQRESIHRGQVAAHRHPQMAQITFWTSGSGVYAIEDETWTFSAPTVSFVPAGIVHGFTIEPGTDAIVVSVAEDALAAISGQSLLALDQPVFVSGHGEPLLWRKLEQAILAIQSEYRDALPGVEKILQPLIAVALSGIARLASERQVVALPAPVALAGRLRRLIDRHFRDDWPVERYVAELGTTRHLIDKAAREILGLGVRHAVGERRLIEAKRLLLFTIRTVEDIAYDCGFNDPAYFSRFFRQASGVSPAAWRRTRHGESEKE